MKKLICLILIGALLLTCAGCNVTIHEEDVEELWGEIKNEVGQQASEAWDNVKEEAGQKASEAWEDVKEEAGNMASEAWEDVKEGAGNIASEAWDKVTGKDTAPTETTFDAESHMATIMSEVKEDRTYAFHQLPGIMIDFWSALSKGSDVEEFDPNDYPADKELSGWDDFWAGLWGINGRVYYHPNGGENFPKAGYYTPGDTFKTTSTIPVRPGYHFMGWIRSDVDNYVTLQPGEDASTATEDNEIHLFAFWATDAQRRAHYIDWKADPQFSSQLWLDHNLSVVESKDHYISLHCSCGMQTTDRAITKDEFTHFKVNDNFIDFAELSEKEQAAVTRQYGMYMAQDYAVAIFLFSGKCCDLSVPEYAVTPALMDVLKGIASFNDVSKAYREHPPETLNDADEFLLKGVPAAKVVTDTATAFNIYKLASFYQANKESLQAKAYKTPDEMAQGILWFLDSAEIAASSSPIAFQYKEYFKVLKEGIALWQKCEEHRLNLYDTLDLNFTGSENLEQILGGKYKDVLDASRNDIFSGPSAFEVIDRMSAAGMDEYGRIPGFSDSDHRLLGAYLSRRLEYEFTELTGITLDEYIQYVS